MSEKKVSVPDCRKCGACCVEQLIMITARDRNIPFPMIEDSFMRKQSGRCVALTGRVGVRVSCSIYPNRPEICRVMQPGVEQCHIIRQSLNLEV